MGLGAFFTRASNFLPGLAVIPTVHQKLAEETGGDAKKLTLVRLGERGGETASGLDGEEGLSPGLRACFGILVNKDILVMTDPADAGPRAGYFPKHRSAFRSPQQAAQRL